MTTFAELGLSDPLLKALGELGFETPSKIQSDAIPILVSQHIDFIGLAQTGTGKTAAFGLPLLEKVVPTDNFTQVLVLAPTRELGQQIGDQLKAFSKFQRGVKIETVYGGAPIDRQIRSIKEKSPHVIIATPGRLLDLVKRKVIDLTKINLLVLDEADEMLNMGFKEDIDTVLSHTSGESVTWLFSATMPPEIRQITTNYMVNPAEVRIAPKMMVNENISHHYYLVHRDDKTQAIIRLLDSEPDMLGIIFCRTKADTQQLADDLNAKGYPVEALHGDLNQTQRDRVMRKFKEHKIKLITATDVAARGIDVKNVSHVIHHSLPDDSEYYTHRSGRTARAGEKGISVSLATKGDLRKIDQFSKKLKLDISQEKMPTMKDVAQQRINTWINLIYDVKETADETLVDEVIAKLGVISKEDLIQRLIVMQLSSMTDEKDMREPVVGENDRKYDGGGGGGGYRGGRPKRNRVRGSGGKSGGGHFGGSHHGTPKNAGSEKGSSKRHMSRRRK